MGLLVGNNTRAIFVFALLLFQLAAGVAVGAEEEEASGEESEEDGEAASKSPLDDALLGDDADDEDDADESKATDDAAEEKEKPAAADDEEEASSEGKFSSPYDDDEETGDDETDDGEEVVDFEEVEVEYDGSGEDGGFFPTEFDGDIAARRDRGVNILTARTTRPMALTLTVDHRPYQTLFHEDAFFNYLGLDYGQLKMGLGLRFGILEGLDAGIYRLNDGGTVQFDTYELDVRYAFLRQEKHHIDVAARAGVSWFAQKGAKDAVGGYGQIFIDRVLFDMLLLGAGFQFHSESTNDVKSTEDTAYSGAVQAVVEWRLLQILALTLEASYAVVGYNSDRGDTKGWPALTFALKFLTFRHTFAIMLSNTQFINSDGIVANTNRDLEQLIFGFQITREFNFSSGGE